jgi:hypothetical protein
MSEGLKQSGHSRTRSLTRYRSRSGSPQLAGFMRPLTPGTEDSARRVRKVIGKGKMSAWERIVEWFAHYVLT